jgi:hypothetical protein
MSKDLPVDHAILSMISDLERDPKFLQGLNTLLGEKLIGFSREIFNTRKFSASNNSIEDK